MPGWASASPGPAQAWPAAPAAAGWAPVAPSVAPSWSPPPPGADPHLAAWAASRRLELVQADLVALKALEPWAFLPRVVASGREVRGPFLDGTVSLVEVIRGGLGRATGEDRSVLAIVQTPRVRARAAVRSRSSAGFADNVTRGMKMIDALVAEPSAHVGVNTIGDALLESHFELRCPTAMEGHAALPPPLRAHLVHQHFRGTLELRLGRFAMAHFDVTTLEPKGLEFLLAAAAAVAQALGP